MPRYYHDNDGMEPRLEFRLVNGYEFTILLPVGDAWITQLEQAIVTRPGVVSAKITHWNGQPLLDLQDHFNSPRTVKRMREDDT